MGRFLIVLILGLLLVPLGAFLYLQLGYAPAATSAAPLPFEKTIAGMALKARIAKEAPANAGVALSDEALMEGAKVYRQQCAVCHGIDDQPKTAIAHGMYPPPPQLFHGKGVTDDPVGETYWKVANGIRLTGMPGYMGSLSEAQLWQVSLLLANANHLPPAVKTFVDTPLGP